MIATVATVRNRLFTGLCLAFLGVVACTRHSESRATPFPNSNEVAGWTRPDDVRTFPAADLWKYIDGEAERYLKAGVQSVSTTGYRFRDRFDATVDVYTMGSIAGVSEILAAEPAAGAEAIQLGDGARLYGGSLVFRKGPHLVRITAYENSAETPPALLALARGVESRLTK